MECFPGKDLGPELRFHSVKDITKWFHLRMFSLLCMKKNSHFPKLTSPWLHCRRERSATVFFFGGGGAVWKCSQNTNMETLPIAHCINVSVR